MSERAESGDWNSRYDWLYSAMEKHLERRDAARVVSYQKATWTLLTATAFIALTGAANNQQFRGAIKSAIEGNLGSDQYAVLILALLLILSFFFLFSQVVLAYFPRDLKYPFALMGGDEELGDPISINKDRERSRKYNLDRWNYAIQQYFVSEEEFRASILDEYITADTEHMVLEKTMKVLVKRAFISMVVVAIISLIFLFV